MTNNIPAYSRDVSQVYVIYPGTQGNVNYGFHPSHPQAPPPKYEDVISGRSQEQQPVAPPTIIEGHRLETTPDSVIYLAPAYKPSNAQKVIGSLFTIIFFIVMTSVLIKILGNR